MYLSSLAKAIAKNLVPAGMALALCAGHAGAQTGLLYYTGIWNTVPFSGLSTPSGVTGDAAGNLYVSDSSATSIFKLAADGITQTSIGNGLNAPAGIAADLSGNIYVTSNGDNKVYKITPGGTQTPLGSGWSSPVSIAVDTSGDVFVTDQSGLSEVTSGGSQSILISGATMQGVAVDPSNNLYYADGTNVFEIPFGTSSPSSLFFASDVHNFYVDIQGSIYLPEASFGVQRNDGASGSSITYGDTTTSYGVWEDSRQNLYIADASGEVEKLALGPVDFGSVNVCPHGATVTPCSSSQTLHFALDAYTAATETMSAVTQGAVGWDYSIDADSCSGDLGNATACTTTVTFAPRTAGTRTGEVESVGSSILQEVASPVGPHPRVKPPVRPRDLPPGSLLASVPLHGIGLAPIGVFSTAPITTTTFAGLAHNYVYGVTVTADGSLYTTDSGNCVVQKYLAGATTVVAGTGTCGPAAGDGAAATSATLSNPLRTAVDGAGNLYIVDNGAREIREVDKLTGIISTVAGTGASGYTGDGGPATSATFENIEDIALDGEGNYYLADASNSDSVVRRVDAVTGIITTIAGNGTSGYTGDGGPATSAELSGPDGVAVDNGGNLYIADDNNNVIRKVSNGVITTVAGTGTAGYSGDGGAATSAEIHDPEGLTLDVAGNIYFPDSGNNVVRKVNVSTGIISTVAGTFNTTETYTGDGGPAIQAGLSYMEAVAVGPDGNIYIADSDNAVIRQVTASGGMATFGSIALGNSAAAQDTTFSNTGTSSLAVSALLAPAGYNLAGAGTTCTSSTTLLVDAECVFGVEFAPVADGVQSGNIVVTDNGGNRDANAQAIAVTGTGTGAAVPARLAFTGAIPSIVAGGSLGTVSVAVEDVGSNLVPGATNSVTLTITGPGGYTHSVTVSATNGVANFNLSSLALTTPGTYTLTATSTGLIEATATLTVTANTPATPVQLSIASPVPATIGAGSNPGVVVVDVENSAGAIVPGATNSVTLTLTGPGGYSYSLTVAAVAGVASFDFTSLGLSTPGTYTLTATSGNLTAATATFTIAVDFTIAFTAGSVTTANIPPGGVAVYAFTLAPAATSFRSPIVLMATGLPAGATYSFAPPTVTPGSSPAATVLTIQTARNTSVAMRQLTGWETTIAFGLLLLPISGSRRMRRAFRRGPLLSMALALLALGTVAGLAGCGAGGLFGQSQHTYTITVTGTSGSLSHSATVTLTVQ